LSLPAPLDERGCDTPDNRPPTEPGSCAGGCAGRSLISDLLLVLLFGGWALGAVVFHTALDQPLLRSLVYGLSAAWGLIFLLVALLKLVEFFWPVAPVCPCGRAGRRDYVWTGVQGLHAPGPIETHYACPCGRQWVRRGRDFLEKLPEGGRAPYSRRRWLRWRPPGP